MSKVSHGSSVASDDLCRHSSGRYGLSRSSGGDPSVNPPATIKFAPRSPEASRRGYSRIVKRVAPAVVNISSSRVITTGMQQDCRIAGMRGGRRKRQQR